MTIHLRKMYVDCRFGQLHLHTSFPSSGGFDELTPLLCVTPPTLTGRAFRPVLRDLGRDRSVYAPTCRVQVNRTRPSTRRSWPTTPQRSST